MTAQNLPSEPMLDLDGGWVESHEQPRSVHMLAGGDLVVIAGGQQYVYDQAAWLSVHWRHATVLLVEVQDEADLQLSHQARS